MNVIYLEYVIYEQLKVEDFDIQLAYWEKIQNGILLN